MKYKPTTVVCTADQVAMNGIPDEIKLLPLGMVHNQKQDFIVDDESCQMIIDNFKGRRLDLVIDYEHQTLKDVQAPAAGWIKELRKGTDAIMAKVEWTHKGKEYLQNKEYRYLSPVVMVRKVDHKAQALHSAALTNTPAIDGMFAIVNSTGFSGGEIDYSEGGEDAMELLQVLAKMLNLPETAAEEDIRNAVQALLEKNKKQAEPEVVANSTILTLLGLKADAKTEDVAGKIQQLQNGSTGVAAELQALKEDLAKKEASSAVDMALKDGKISAAQKEWASTYALKDLEGFKNFCEKTVPVVPMKNMGLTDAPTTKSAEVEPTVLKALGLTKEDLEKYADKEA